MQESLKRLDTIANKTRNDYRVESLVQLITGLRAKIKQQEADSDMTGIPITNFRKGRYIANKALLIELERIMEL